LTVRKPKPSASRLGPSSRFQNQIRNRVRLRYERDVTRLDLDRFRPHALCHEAFEIGVDGPILRGDGIPAWLRPPCRVSGFAGEQGLMEWPLDRAEHLCLRFRQVARKITKASILAEASFAPSNMMPADAGGVGYFLGQGRVIFVSIRRSRSHIDNRRDVRMHTGVCNDHPGKRMPS